MIEIRQQHVWVDIPYGTSECRYCSVNSYETGTTYCDEWREIQRVRQEKAEGRHQPTNEAIAIARQALTKEQWSLLGLERLAPYRDRDYIMV